MITAFWGCRFCGGRGCLACEQEAAKEYKRQFPDGPTPIATVSLDDAEEIARFRRAFGMEAIEKAFSDTGGGVSEILENARSIGFGTENGR